eukprot:1279184-Pleurochrysis_carterae.AAC.1
MAVRHTRRRWLLECQAEGVWPALQWGSRLEGRAPQFPPVGPVFGFNDRYCMTGHWFSSWTHNFDHSNLEVLCSKDTSIRSFGMPATCPRPLLEPFKRILLRAWQLLVLLSGAGSRADGSGPAFRRGHRDPRRSALHDLPILTPLTLCKPRTSPHTPERAHMLTLARRPRRGEMGRPIARRQHCVCPLAHFRPPTSSPSRPHLPLSPSAAAASPSGHDCKMYRECEVASQPPSIL